MLANKEALFISIAAMQVIYSCRLRLVFLRVF